MSHSPASPGLHTFATSSALVESPQARRCFPSLYTSPGFDTGTSGVSGTSFGSVAPISSVVPPISSSISDVSNPSASMSNPASWSACSSALSSSSFHSATSPVLLSAMRSARSCSGVRWSTTMAGIVSAPSSFIALTRVWPLMMTRSLFTMIAPMNPYWRMDATTPATAWSLLRGLRSYGVSESIRRFSILAMSFAFPGFSRQK